MTQHTQVAKQPKRHKRRTVAKVLGALLGIVVVGLAGLIGFLTVTEYRPADTESLLPEGSAAQTIAAGDEFSVLTWNIGYGALGDNADFFMDGGTHVNTASAERVAQNMADIVSVVETAEADVALFQEVDVDSDRSDRIDEAALLRNQLANMQSFFATNYRTAFVPLGIPPYGKIDGGLLSCSSYAVDRASRESLPSSYSWPMSTVQLKRCELVTRIPVEGTDRKLVIINEHPDAYTSEEHHAAQIDAIRDTLMAEAAAGNYVIAGGDWNHTFSNVDTSSYPLIDEDNWQAGIIDTDSFEQGWQFVMDERTPTCRLLDHPLATEDGVRYEQIVQYYMLDGFIVSSNVKVLQTETLDCNFVASDHNPVVMKVLLEQD